MNPRAREGLLLSRQAQSARLCHVSMPLPRPVSTPCRTRTGPLWSPRPARCLAAQHPAVSRWPGSNRHLILTMDALCQLSYIGVEKEGLEPSTSCLQGRRSIQLELHPRDGGRCRGRTGALLVVSEALCQLS